jgi:transcriptional regulator with XRE-family HTH domain
MKKGDIRIAKMLLLAQGIGSQRELAKRLGVTEWTLSKTLRGHRKNPALLKKVARVLKVPPELLRAA